MTGIFSPISVAVITARTPSIARAAEVSMLRMRPWATPLRKMTACNIPSRLISAMKLPVPARKRRSSARSTGCPISDSAVTFMVETSWRKRSGRTEPYSWTRRTASLRLDEHPLSPALCRAARQEKYRTRRDKKLPGPPRRTSNEDRRHEPCDERPYARLGRLCRQQDVLRAEPADADDRRPAHRHGAPCRDPFRRRHARHRQPKRRYGLAAAGLSGQSRRRGRYLQDNVGLGGNH